MNISLPSYLWSWNIGDAIQTIALRDLVEPMLNIDQEITYRNRVTGDGAEPDDIFILNGYIDERWKPQPAKTTIVAGIHIANDVVIYRLMEMLENNQITGKIGCRDPHTFFLLQQFSIPCEFIGCATLTFPRNSKERLSGAIYVDVPDYDYNRRAAMQISHYIPPTITWEQQLQRAAYFLDLYKNHCMVYTTRIHAALPCLAFGTKVSLDRVDDNRLTLLDEIGIKYNSPATLDVTDISKKFRSFVRQNLSAALE